MGKLKIGIIGCGGIANQKHFPALKNNGDLNEIVAFCDIIRERAEKAAEEFGSEGAKVYTDYRELLADPEVEVVHICTPNVSHSEIAVAAFAAKKHVYCEKPMSHGRGGEDGRGVEGIRNAVYGWVSEPFQTGGSESPCGLQEW